MAVHKGGKVSKAARKLADKSASKSEKAKQANSLPNTKQKSISFFSRSAVKQYNFFTYFRSVRPTACRSPRPLRCLACVAYVVEILSGQTA